VVVVVVVVVIPLVGCSHVQVMVGNLREDVLWQLHDVFVSKSMLAHHTLPYYITTIARLPL